MQRDQIARQLQRSEDAKWESRFDSWQRGTQGNRPRARGSAAYLASTRASVKRSARPCLKSEDPNRGRLRPPVLPADDPLSLSSSDESDEHHASGKENSSVSAGRKRSQQYKQDHMDLVARLCRVSVVLSTWGPEDWEAGMPSPNSGHRWQRALAAAQPPLAPGVELGHVCMVVGAAGLARSRGEDDVFPGALDLAEAAFCNADGGESLGAPASWRGWSEHAAPASAIRRSGKGGGTMYPAEGQTGAAAVEALAEERRRSWSLEGRALAAERRLRACQDAAEAAAADAEELLEFERCEVCHFSNLHSCYFVFVLFGRIAS